MRIAAKRARYAAEAIGPYIGGSRKTAALAACAAKLQDALGRLQDAVVLRADVESTLSNREGDSAFALAAGRLIERQENVKREVRASYPVLRDEVEEAIARWKRAG